MMRVMFLLDGICHPVFGQRAAGVVEDEYVVCGHVHETVQQAPLREVDLLAIPGREGEVERPDQVESVAAYVHAMPDGRGQVRIESQRLLEHRAGGMRQVLPLWDSRLRPVALGDREDRAVVGQRTRRRDQRVRKGGSSQALEPTGGDHAVAVEDDNVGWRRRREGGVYVAREAKVDRLAQVAHLMLELVLQRIHEGADRRIGAGVVRDHYRDVGRGVGEHAGQTLGKLLLCAVDRNADHRLATLGAERRARRKLMQPGAPRGPCPCAKQAQHIVRAALGLLLGPGEVWLPVGAKGIGKALA